MKQTETEDRRFTPTSYEYALTASARSATGVALSESARGGIPDEGYPLDRLLIIALDTYSTQWANRVDPEYGPTDEEVIEHDLRKLIVRIMADIRGDRGRDAWGGR